MVSLENLLLYIPLAALLVMLPGPDFALIVRTSLTEGRSSGQAAACGVALGIMVHTSAAMLGISAVIAQSVTLFTLLRYAGAAYLFWMGIHALRAGREVTAAVVRHGGQEEEVQPVRGLRRRAFRQGFLTNALNPKAVVFFLTMLPQFLDPHAALWPQFLELGGIMAFFCLGWFVLLASLLHRIRRLFAAAPAHGPHLHLFRLPAGAGEDLGAGRTPAVIPEERRGSRLLPMPVTHSGMTGMAPLPPSGRAFPAPEPSLS